MYRVGKRVTDLVIPHDTIVQQRGNIMELAQTDSNQSGYFYPTVAKPAAKEKINLDASVASKLWDESMMIGKLNK